MKHKVLIMRCESYEPSKIAGILREGMQELDVHPHGNIILKPNVVIAHPELFPHAYTRKEFLDGVIEATRKTAEASAKISVGERSGITLPTRYCFRKAGYPEVIRKHRVRTSYFDEELQVPISIPPNGHTLRDRLFVPLSIAQCDFLVNLPKFKAHPWCRLTLSLKNFIGIQDDRHRLVDHNQFLEHKIADLQAVIQPGFIAVDAISAGQRMMLTPTPFHMGAIIMGINSCAVDTVGCHMVHVDPQDLIHLKYASERGFGPMDLDQIELSGDFSLEAVRDRTRDFKFCFERVDDYFGQEGNLRCTVGRFPEKHSTDYCWGGCPGALQEAVHIFQGFDPDVNAKMGKVRYVVGKVDGPIDLAEDESVIFAGDCTRWKGTIDQQPVEIKGHYRRVHEVDQTRTRSNDMLKRTLQVMWACFRRRKSRYIHARGCPVSVGDHVHYLSAVAKIKNVNFDPRLIVPINLAYWKMRFFRCLNHLRERWA